MRSLHHRAILLTLLAGMGPACDGEDGPTPDPIPEQVTPGMPVGVFGVYDCFAGPPASWCDEVARADHIVFGTVLKVETSFQPWEHRGSHGEYRSTSRCSVYQHPAIVFELDVEDDYLGGPRGPMVFYAGHLLTERWGSWPGVRWEVGSSAIVVGQKLGAFLTRLPNGELSIGPSILFIEELDGTIRSQVPVCGGEYVDVPASVDEVGATVGACLASHDRVDPQVRDWSPGWERAAECVDIGETGTLSVECYRHADCADDLSCSDNGKCVR